jgi:hypothetical protein
MLHFGWLARLVPMLIDNREYTRSLLPDPQADARRHGARTYFSETDLFTLLMKMMQAMS